MNQIEHLDSSSESGVELPTREDATSEGHGCAVRLGGRAESPSVKGVLKPRLTPARYDIIQALIAAGENGLTGDELIEKSGHGGAINTLKRLAASDSDWGAVIQLAGVPNGRYRILRSSDRD
jgi:hypothetical protein